MSVSREDIARIAPGNPRLVVALETTINSAPVVAAQAAASVAATDALDQATVLTLSPNTAFRNERVLAVGTGLRSTDNGASLALDVNDTVARVSGGFACSFIVTGNTMVALPLTGVLATVGNAETLSNKTLAAPKLSGLGNYANDGAAAGGGVPVGGVYRNGSALMVRVT